MLKSYLSNTYKFFVICCLISLNTFAVFAEEDNLRANADSAYMSGKYNEAIDGYLQLAKEETSADLYYNLGCAYFRTNNIASSILWFERAHKLNPNDKDIKYNLEYARSQTIDKIPTRNRMLIADFFYAIVNHYNLKQWTAISIVFFILFIATLAAFSLISDKRIKKWLVVLGVFFLIADILFHVCAFLQKANMEDRSYAILMSSSVIVRSTPSDEGKELFTIHEGTRIKITDNELKDWCEIVLDDGNVGWIRQNTFEII